MPRKPYKSVHSAYLWTNGQVMAFDSNGKQVPEYQGHKDEAIPKLQRDFPNLRIAGLNIGGLNWPKK